MRNRLCNLSKGELAMSKQPGYLQVCAAGKQPAPAYNKQLKKPILACSGCYDSLSFTAQKIILKANWYKHIVGQKADGDICKIPADLKIGNADYVEAKYFVNNSVGYKYVEQLESFTSHVDFTNSYSAYVTKCNRQTHSVSRQIVPITNKLSGMDYAAVNFKFKIKPNRDCSLLAGVHYQDSEQSPLLITINDTVVEEEHLPQPNNANSPTQKVHRWTDPTVCNLTAGQEYIIKISCCEDGFNGVDIHAVYCDFTLPNLGENHQWQNPDYFEFTKRFFPAISAV